MEDLLKLLNQAPNTLNSISDIYQYTQNYYYMDSLMQLENKYVLNVNILKIIFGPHQHIIIKLLKSIYNILLLKTLQCIPNKKMHKKVQDQYCLISNNLKNYYLELFDQLNRENNINLLDTIFFIISLNSRIFYKKALLQHKNKQLTQKIDEFVQREEDNMMKNGKKQSKKGEDYSLSYGQCSIEAIVYQMIINETTGNSFNIKSFNYLKKKYVKKQIFVINKYANFKKTFRYAKKQVNNTQATISQSRRVIGKNNNNNFLENLTFIKNLLKTDDLSGENQQKCKKCAFQHQKIDTITKAIEILLEKRQKEIKKLGQFQPNHKSFYQRKQSHSNQIYATSKLNRNFKVQSVASLHKKQEITANIIKKKRISSQGKQLINNKNTKANSLSLSYHQIFKKYNRSKKIVYTQNTEQTVKNQNSTETKMRNSKFQKLRSLHYSQAKQNFLINSLQKEKRKTSLIKIQKFNNNIKKSKEQQQNMNKKKKKQFILLKNECGSHSFSCGIQQIDDKKNSKNDKSKQNNKNNISDENKQVRKFAYSEATDEQQLNDPPKYTDLRLVKVFHEKNAYLKSIVNSQVDVTSINFEKRTHKLKKIKKNFQCQFVKRKSEIQKIIQEKDQENFIEDFQKIKVL